MWTGNLIQSRVLIAVFLFLVSFIAFVPSLRNDFVWDDIVFIKNRYYSLKASNVNSKLIIRDTLEDKESRYFRPIFRISLIIDHEIWGLSPSGFHLSNIVFHSASTVLFYFLVLLMLRELGVKKKDPIAFLSSLLFALHPMHVEAVSWIAARADLICSMFLFLAIIFHILSTKRLCFLMIAALCFFLSMLSKEIGIAFVILVIGFDLIAYRQINTRSLLRYAVYGVLVLLYLYLRGRSRVNIPALSSESVQQSAGIINQAWDIISVLLSSYLFYIVKLVFPFQFNAFIAEVPTDFYYPIASILIILLLCLVFFTSIKKREGVDAYAILWVLTTLGPPSLLAILAVGAAPLAERFTYIASAGFCMLAGYLLFIAVERVRVKAIAWAFVFILCLSYLSFTVDRQGVWRDSLALWEDTSKKSFYNAVPHLNYGEALRNVGKQDDAIKEFLLVFDPRINGSSGERAKAANNIGVAYINKGKPKNARKWLFKALDHAPDYIIPYHNIGTTYFLEGDYEKAETWFLKYIQHNPREVRTYYHLGVLYFMKARNGGYPSDFITAEKYLKEALRIHPYYAIAHLVLAQVYTELGKKQDAKEHAEIALNNGLNGNLIKEAEEILKVSN